MYFQLRGSAINVEQDSCQKISCVHYHEISLSYHNIIFYIESFLMLTISSSFCVRPNMDSFGATSCAVVNHCVRNNHNKIATTWTQSKNTIDCIGLCNFSAFMAFGNRVCRTGTHLDWWMHRTSILSPLHAPNWTVTARALASKSFTYTQAREQINSPEQLSLAVSTSSCADHHMHAYSCHDCVLGEITSRLSINHSSSNIMIIGTLQSNLI